MGDAEAHKRKKEEKMDAKKKARTNNPEEWPQCKFWMKTKNRFCNMGMCPRSIWCGVHAHDADVVGGNPPAPLGLKGDVPGLFRRLESEAAAQPGSEGSQAGGADGEKPREAGSVQSRGRRIPCPHDPRHSIYEKDLAKHVHHCPKYKQAKKQESQVFFDRDINLGERGPAAREAEAEAEEEEVDPEEEERRLQRGEVSEQFRAKLLRELSKGVDMQAFAAHIEKAYVRHVGDVVLEVLRPGSCERLFTSACEEAKKGHKAGRATLRHLEQQASIVGHMEQRGLLGKGWMYIEMGAGRATLSRTLKEALKGDMRLCVVERSGCRYKADNNIKGLGDGNTASNTAGGSSVEHGVAAGSFRRVQIDIAHLNLAKLDFVSDVVLAAEGPGGGERRAVSIGKHLCGGATDLALRCAVNTLPARDALQGIAIATCCHHRCDHGSYINMPFFERELAGKGGEGSCWGLELVRLCSSWACIGGPRVAMPGAEVGGGGGAAGGGGAGAVSLSHEQKVRLGRQCKRLLDWGRVLWLRERGFKAELVHFCSEETTPENCLLIAWKDDASE